MLDIEKVEGYLTGPNCQESKQYDWCCYHYPKSNFTEDMYEQSCNGCERFSQRHFYDQGSLSMGFINGKRFRVFTPYDEEISDDQIDAEIRKKFTSKS